MRWIAFTLALALLAGPVAAQDARPSPEEETNPDRLPDDDAKSEDAETREKTAALLSQALRQLRRTQDLVVLASIEHKEAGGGGALGGLPANMRQRMFGQGLTPFTGNVEAWVAADGATVILSESEVPGFAVYTAGDRTVTRRTTDDGQDLTLANVTRELAPLLDVMRLTRHLAEAKLAAKTDATTGEVTFTGELPRETVNPLGDGNLSRVRTLRVNATLVVTPEGRLERIAVEVIHNDPVAEGRRGGRVRILVQGGGGQVVPVEEDKDKHDIEGGKTTYRLSFVDAEPSERARDFRRRIERILQKRPER